VHAADLLRAVEIGERPRHPQHPMIASRRQPHGVGGIAQQSQTRAVRPRDIFHQARRSRRVGADAGKAQRGVAVELHGACLRDAGRDLFAALRRRRQDQV
jgi:hypothetical protein